jgi:hypothetical protein
MPRINLFLRAAFLCGGVASIVGFGEALTASVLGHVPFSLAYAIKQTFFNCFVTVYVFFMLLWVGRTHQKNARRSAKSKPSQSGDLAEL